MILIALTGSGAIHLTNRATSSYTDQQLLNMALTQMNAALHSQDVCTTAPVIQLPNNVSLTATVQGCAVITTTISLVATNPPTTGVSVNVPTPPVLSVNSPLLGGQVVVGGTWTSSP